MFAQGGMNEWMHGVRILGLILAFFCGLQWDSTNFLGWGQRIKNCICKQTFGVVTVKIPGFLSPYNVL